MLVNFPPKRILCPVDFSPHSSAALRETGKLSTAFGADVVVLHAHHLEAPAYFTAAQTKALREELRKSAQAGRAHLAEFTASHLPGSVRRSIVLLDEDPVSAILRHIQKSAIDLVVMGTHGRTGLTRIRLGSVMESVLHQIKIPLITVGPHVKASFLSGPVRRILCPVSLNRSTQTAFEYATQIAHKTGAELIVLHVTEGETGSAETTERLQDKLCDWIPPDVRRQCSIQEAVRQGNAVEQIVTHASESEADLLVIDAYPKNVLRIALFGSTTEGLIRNASCPVVTIISKA